MKTIGSFWNRLATATIGMPCFTASKAWMILAPMQKSTRPAASSSAVVGLRAALHDGHVEPVFGIGAVDDRLIEAAMLGLRPANWWRRKLCRARTAGDGRAQEGREQGRPARPRAISVSQNLLGRCGPTGCRWRSVAVCGLRASAGGPRAFGSHSRRAESAMPKLRVAAKHISKPRPVSGNVRPNGSRMLGYTACFEMRRRNDARADGDRIRATRGRTRLVGRNDRARFSRRRTWPRSSPCCRSPRSSSMGRICRSASTALIMQGYRRA